MYIYIYIYIQVSFFPFLVFNSTWYWVRSTLVVPPFDCHEKVNWFDDFANIYFSVFFGAHTLKFVHDLIGIQFVDRNKQVKKNNGIVHFRSLKGDHIRYREVTALYRSTLQNIYGNIFREFSESCLVAVVYRVTTIYGAVTYRFKCSFFFVFFFGFSLGSS